MAKTNRKNKHSKLSKLDNRKNNVIYMEQNSVSEYYGGGMPAINILPKTPGQDAMIKLIKERSLVFAQGPAGTGKTYCAVGIAAQLYKAKDIRKIILARPNISTGPSLGAFPGDVNDKLWKWLAQPIDVLKELLGRGAPECMLKKENLILEPLEVVRGRSWDNAFIFIDEAQNLTTQELKAISTRLGKNSTMVIAGDTTQSDIRRGGVPCQDYHNFIQLLQEEADKEPDNYPDLSTEFGVATLTDHDIVRSGMVKDLVRIFNKHHLV